MASEVGSRLRYIAGVVSPLEDAVVAVVVLGVESEEIELDGRVDLDGLKGVRIFITW
jgi:hypothetical protein